MAEPPYRPRTDDHLVEPLFGGLGLEAEAPPGRRGWLGALRSFCGRLWRRLRRLSRRG